jgi:hypothetical protein
MMMLLRNLAFVAVATAISVFTSERAYWYFSHAPADQLMLMAFYGPAVASVPYLIDKYRAGGLLRFLLVIPVFAYLVEGAIVPVLYSGGPMVPFFPAMFTFWHGMLGIGLMLFMVRRWLLARRWKPLLATSIGFGAYWGMWAITAVVESQDPGHALADGSPPPLREPTNFALYAAGFSAAFIVAHWLLGFVWQRRFTPPKLAVRIWLVVVGLVIGAWTVAVPWAAPMFAAYAGLQIWALRRTPSAPGPTLLEQLHGRVRIRDLWPLLAIPIAATPSYAFWWGLDLSPSQIEDWIFILQAFLQAVVGAWALVWSHLRARRVRKAVAVPADVSPVAVA